MKRRLLFLFAVFMVGASVGWGQMIPTYYKVAVGTGGDGSSAGSPIYKANLEAALSDAALSSLDSVIILLPEGSMGLIRFSSNKSLMTRWPFYGSAAFSAGYLSLWIVPAPPFAGGHPSY